MLQELGLKYNTDKAGSHRYCNIYEKLFPTRIGTMFEIGVLDGASLRMWSEYYPDAKIVGFDVLDKSYLDLPANVSTRLLDQGNLPQLQDIRSSYNDIDVIIDDGSHLMNHQILTFETLFDCLRHDGIFVVEDLHTSTNLYTDYGYNPKTNKGSLQYLMDIVQNVVPRDYPGQYRTGEVIKQIKNIDIITNLGTDRGRSITAIITRR